MLLLDVIACVTTMLGPLYCVTSTGGKGLCFCAFVEKQLSTYESLNLTGTFCSA